MVDLINLPEKYYENCLTYNIVNYYVSNFDKYIYPFTISQREEKEEGYDFGYCLNDFFAIQYKKPILLESSYSWRISKEQLNVIIRNGLYTKIFYAFPAFHNITQWYSALDHCYFIRADRLFSYLNKKKKSTINSNKDIEVLLTWGEITKEIKIIYDKKYYGLSEISIENQLQKFYRTLKEVTNLDDGLLLFGLFMGE